MVNVTGSLQKKNNVYQAVLSFKDQDHWKTKWISTRIKTTRGNKRRALAELERIRLNFQENLNNNIDNSDIQFIDFMKNWLKIIKPSIEETTFCGYDNIINGRMSLYFKDKDITLNQLKPKHIQDFYQYLIDCKLSGNTVKHYHANIKAALKYAMKTEIISSNPADKVQLPKVQQYTAGYFSPNDILSIFQAVKNTNLETPVILASFYGLRRSEIVGLQWSSIDFSNKTISIKHIVTQINENHSIKIIQKDRTKTKSSTRTLPLLPEVEAYLIELRQKQNHNKLIYKNDYNMENIDYLCVDNLGNLIAPNHISQYFRNLLIKNNLPVHRFHDLRHSLASLLLNKGISMKQIQMWLGHSNYTTTANIYAHLDTSSMNRSADVITKTLQRTSVVSQK